MAYPADAGVRVYITKDDAPVATSDLYNFHQIWEPRGWIIVGYVPDPEEDGGVFLPESALWRGVYSAGTTYYMNQIVGWAVGGFDIQWIARNGPLTGQQPDLHPEAWDVYSVGGGNAETILSEGSVGGGYNGPASSSGGTPSYVDVAGCAVAPNTTGPITLRVRGPLVMTGAASFRLWFQILDDLNAVVGGHVERCPVASPGLIKAMNFDVKADPDIAGRTYRLQASMTDATGGGFQCGGTLIGGAGNAFRLEAVPRG